MPTLVSTLLVLALILLTAESALLMVLYANNRKHIPGKHAPVRKQSVGRHAATGQFVPAPPPPAPPVYKILDLTSHPRYVRNGQPQRVTPGTVSAHTNDQGVSRHGHAAAA